MLSRVNKTIFLIYGILEKQSQNLNILNERVQKGDSGKKNTNSYQKHNIGMYGYMT